MIGIFQYLNTVLLAKTKKTACNSVRAFDKTFFSFQSTIPGGEIDFVGADWNEP